MDTAPSGADSPDPSARSGECGRCVRRGEEADLDEVGGGDADAEVLLVAEAGEEGLAKRTAQVISALGSVGSGRCSAR